jgi:hypothetical protein
MLVFVHLNFQAWVIIKELASAFWARWRGQAQDARPLRMSVSGVTAAPALRFASNCVS